MDEQQADGGAGKEVLSSRSKPSKPLEKALAGLDGRFRGPKRLKALTSALQAQSKLPPGPGRSTLITQAASLILVLEGLTVRLANGELVDDRLVRSTNTLNRVLAALGVVSWDGPPPQDPDQPRLSELLKQKDKP